MVEVRVRDEDGIDVAGVVGERHSAALRFRRRALEEAAVDDHPGALRGEQELGAGDGGRSAQEPKLQR